MTEDSVPLESIGLALQGVIPSPFATCTADGQPNITYMSIVQYVDSDTVALSRQFFNKTRANLDQNPRGQVIVVDPVLGQGYQLDLRYLRTETEGPIFEAMHANLEAVSAAQGMERRFVCAGWTSTGSSGASWRPAWSEQLGPFGIENVTRFAGSMSSSAG